MKNPKPTSRSERKLKTQARDHLERVVSTVFPRIVTNGRWYRIELAHENYDQERGDYGGHWAWESRFLWRARLRLRRVEKDMAEQASRQPERWKPISANDRI